MASSKDVATMMILLGFLSMALCYEGSLAVKRKAKQPNIVFILTDDQDVALFGQYPMPKTKKLIADVGMTFTNMFVTSPLCCPSRSSILSGRFLHNHMTTNNSLSGNCSSTAWQNSAEKKAFPTFLQANGYRTFFAGKYLNEYGSPEVGGVEHIPPGWDVWNGLVGNSVYYNYTLSANGKAEKHGDNYSVDYLTDVIHHKALKFLTTRTSKQPFFMMLSTPACHSPFKSAPQYMVNFTNEKAPRNKQFNIHAQDKHWLIQQAVTPMPNDTIDMIDGFFRNRWRTLLSVDDMVEGVINKLTDIGELDNTYIFFSSDNGYHLGQFSLPFDKRQFYDFDIRVPLMVRGPGIKANTTCQDLIISVDFAPTFLNISGSSQSVVENFDGMSFLSLLTHSSPLSSNTSPRPSISRSFISETKFSDPSLFSAQFSFGGESFRDAILVEYVGEHQNRVPHCPRYKNQGLAESVMSVDLAPTFLDIANLSAPPFFDGMTLKPILQGQTHPFRATVLVEYNGERLDKVDHCPKYNDQGLSNCDNHCVCEDAWNNTYGCIRYETQQESYKYCALQDNDNFVEVYDLKADPYELNNIAKTASPDLLTKLSQDLADLSLCSGSTCHKKSPYPSH